MIFLRLLNLLIGYVVFECNGYFIERFLNITAKRRIGLWGIKRINIATVRAKIKAKEFIQLKEVAKKSNTKIKIIHKRGLPFILHRYRKRKGFFIGVISFFLMLWILSSFVWSIEIKGNIKVNSEQIMQTLKESGILSGKLSILCNINDAKLRLLTNHKELCWVDVAIKGSKVIISVKEGILPPQIIPKDKPCNIVAKKDGQITFIEAYDGIKAVRKGDTVSKGELLISGVIDSTLKSYLLVHSRGIVKARTLTHLKTEISLKKTENIKTGLFYKRYCLQFGNLSVKLYLGDKIKYEQFEKNELINELAIGKDIILPIRFITEVFYETAQTTTEFTQQEGELLCEIAIKEKEKNELIGTLLERKITFKNENNVVICEGEYICEQEIGQEEKIEKNN